MHTVKSHIAVILFLLLSMAATAQVIVKVTNTTRLQRQELIALDADTICSRLAIDRATPFVVYDAIRHEVDYQVSHDGKILIDASVQPMATTTFTIERGVPRRMLSYDTLPVRTAAGGWGVGKVWTSGRLYPDRLDDIAWENDRGAYRVYGPAFKASGSVGYGPDVWVKNTPEPDIDRRFRMDIDIKPTQKQLIASGYQHEADQLLQDNSFHIDHGTGNDCYAVGPTLGCGAPALLRGKGKNADDVVFPYTWEEYEILDNGPLRFTLALTFADTIVDGQHLREHRTYSLDKGSNFNRVEVWYTATNTKATKPLTAIAGFPLHAPNESTVVCGDSYVQYADPTDNAVANSCELYLACLFPAATVTTHVLPLGKDATPHAVGRHTLKPGEHWVYYAGTAWSKYDVRNQDEWQCRINTTLAAINNPLVVTIENRKETCF